MRIRLRHERLARELARSRVSQNRWAQMLGLGRGHLSLLVRGKRPFPSSATRRKLLSGLGLRFEDLFEREGEALPLRKPVRRRPRWSEGGGIDIVHERRSGTMFYGLTGEMRWAVRALGNRPGFLISVLLVLTLGIAPSLCVFSVVDAVLLRQLPYAQAHRLASVGPPLLEVSPVELLDFRQRSRLAESWAGWQPMEFYLTGRGDPSLARGARVTPNLFATLGVQPAWGAGFDPDRDNAGKAVISHRLWRTSFSADPDASAPSLTVNGEPYAVAGVMPEGFLLPSDIEGSRPSDVWLPIDMRSVNPNGRGFKDLLVVARLRTGVPLPALQAEMAGVARELQEESPDWYPPEKAFEIPIVSLHSKTVGKTRPAMALLTAGVALVLLIACVNAANLFLIHIRRIQPDLTLRRLLGAGRARLIRPLLIQCLLVSLLACAAGAAISQGLLAQLQSLAPEGIPRLDEVQITARVLGFGLLLSLLVGLAFGVLPALRASGKGIRLLPQDGPGRATGSGRSRFHGLAILAESALATLLLVGAGLMGKSFWMLSQVDTGFESRGVITFEVSLPRTLYPEAHRVSAFMDELRQGLEGLPGVQFAAAVRKLPLQDPVGSWESRLQDSPRGEELIRPQYQVVTPGYFETLGIKLVAGRSFRSSDDAEAPAVLIVNRSLAEQAWSGQDALGKRLQMGGSPRSPWMQVVGVVADVRHAGLDAPAGPRMYLPHSQYPSSSAFGGPIRRMSFVLGSRLRLEALIEPIKDQVWRIDPSVPVERIRSMEEVVGRSVSRPRFLASLLAGFGIVGLFLAALGVYSVVLLAASLRRHEFGVRISVGARPWDLLRLAAGQGLALTLAGVALGMLSALPLTGLLSALLFSVSPLDFSVMAFAGALLAASGLAASSLPALRSARLDPMSVLKRE